MTRPLRGSANFLPPTPASATLYFDGSARPNPGYGGVGYVLYGVHDNELDRGSYEIEGNDCTSNEAEWCALIRGLEEALRYNIRRLKVHGDSELVINQMNGVYRVNSEHLRDFYYRAKELEENFITCACVHISRDKNTVADGLAVEGCIEGGCIDGSISKWSCTLSHGY